MNQTPERRAQRALAGLSHHAPHGTHRPELCAACRSVSHVADAIVSAIADEKERCAKIAEQDSVLAWVGGSTGSAKDTANNIARAIRKSDADVCTLHHAKACGVCAAFGETQ